MSTCHFTQKHWDTALKINKHRMQSFALKAKLLQSDSQAH